MSNLYTRSSADTFKGFSFSFAAHAVFALLAGAVFVKMSDFTVVTEIVRYRVNLVASSDRTQSHTGSTAETQPLLQTDNQNQTTVIQQDDVTQTDQQNVLPVATGGSDPISVNIPGVGPEDPYIKSIVRKVSRYYSDPLGAGAEIRKATIKFTINSNGEISGAEIEESSGNSALDLAGLRAVRNSSPLPPLPERFGNSVVVHFYFEHK
ncbi:TonB C-terminal domain-containing protein [candidate division WOR-3 bacterium]|nr:TonB C-terminal domain-containing protein [candidate division WOR-3 bacterium]